MKNKTAKIKTVQKTYGDALAQQAASHPKEPKTWMKWTAKVLPPVIVIVLLAAMGWLLNSQEWEMLYRSQELSLFLPTRQFYEGMLIYPGGTLQWLACWFTQFFFHPATGIAMLVGLWALIIALCKGMFKLRGWALLLACLPIMILMASVVQTGYWIFYTKLQGYFFVPTLGILFSLLAAYIHRLIINQIDLDGKSTTTNICILTISMLLMCAFAWKGYQWMGAWSFLGVGLMGLPYSLKNFFRNKENTTNNRMLGGICAVWPILLAVILLIQVPRLAYDHIYCQTQIDTIYRACMPSFQYGQTDNQGMQSTYIILLAFILPMVAHMYRPLGQELKKMSGRTIFALVMLFALWGTGCIVNQKWYRNDNFQKELKMYRMVEESNWQGVLDEAPYWTELDTLKHPTRAMVMMKNLALFRMGKAGDEMFNYLEGAREQKMDSLQVRLTQVGGKMLYYNYGKLNFCYRWCMEDGVEFGWKVEHLKLMARCALLKSEWKVAEKYLKLLQQTRFHREWAEKYMPYIGHPELIKKDESMEPICYLKEFGDRLDGDNTLVELYMLRTFANGHGVDPVYQEQTLIASLIMKDIDLFWPRFHEYVQMHGKEPNFHMPRHYQEAAYLYSMLEPNRPSIMWPGYTNAQAMQAFPFDENVKKSYADFMNFNSRPDIAPLSEQQKRIAFQPYYGNTFYFFYFLVRGQKTN